MSALHAPNATPTAPPTATPDPSPAPRAILGPALAGACATCVGIGLTRFAYVPIFPALVAAGWVNGGQAGQLGAANLAGYILGVLGARLVARGIGVPRALHVGMALGFISLLACALHLGFAWLWGWRFGAGVAGGLLMALAGPAAQAAVPPERRGLVSGIVVAGVGSGVILASLLVPMFLQSGVVLAWVGLAALVLLLWLIAGPRWPRPEAPTGPAVEVPSMRRFSLLILAYGLSGAGMVPPMVYLGDLAARGRGLGLESAAQMWLVFGCGAVLGTLLGGRLAGKLGGQRCMQLWLVLQSVALALTLPPGQWALWPAAALAGFSGVGISAVGLVAARERAGGAMGQLWILATASYAIMQAGIGFILAALFEWSGEQHSVIFAAGLLISLLGLAVALADRARRDQAKPATA